MSPIKAPVQKGDRSVDVGRIQTVLVKMKILPERMPNGKTSVDCDFGGFTETAVKTFQEQSGLKPTGIVDGATLLALIPYRSVRAFGVVSRDFKLKPPSVPVLPSSPFQLPRLSLPDLGLAPIHPPSDQFGYRMRWPAPADSSGSSSAGAGSSPQGTSDGRGWVFQPQTGPQFLTRPIVYSGAPTDAANNPSGSWQFQFWFTYRTRKDGMHLEVGLGPGFSANYLFGAPSDQAVGFTLSGNVSIMIADIFARGSFHLLSPVLQFGLNANADQNLGFTSGGITLNAGNQMSWEIIDDRLIFSLTPGLWLGYDFKSQQTLLAPGMGVAIGGNLPF